ncbi:hypothetical protein DEO72_LG7g3078 [Vigna unguiculata]|uniref:Uncharacterized protein n=1 Tax=Vigna unguiculata TaxID=3917 RepID=A0A4D6MLA1_VIGUN|nr:hypothetical protein DEO72_LG7g3078 [Vigna unguiculata]
MAKQRNHHSLVDHENLAHLLPSTKLMIIARKTATYNTTMQRNGLALNEFQASCYSRHKSQSALSETNWLLGASGCNLTLNPYLVIQMGHHHEHPLSQESHPTLHCLAQHLAQAEESRSGETVSLRRTPPSPRRGFDEAPMEHHGISLRRDPSRLGEMFPRSKFEQVAWATFRAIILGELPVSSRLGEMDSFRRD